MYPNLNFENFYESTLTQDLSDSATDVFLDPVPTYDEGFLVIDPTSSNREIIWYDSKTSSKVVAHTGTGRGFDGTTASEHTTGTRVIMAPIAEMFRLITNAGQTLETQLSLGWVTGALPDVSTVTSSGNRQYEVTFASTVAALLSPGNRIRTTRTAPAPTQCADFETGSSQYYSKSSPSGMTFTDDFVVSAWVKLESYPASGNYCIASRYNGTSGWSMFVSTAGRVYLTGVNGGSSNFRRVSSIQSIPVGRWVHIAGQLDMSTYTLSSTTCFMMFDGVDIPAALETSGTNPTAIVQAGNLQIGAGNTTDYMDGEMAQVAIYSAKVTQETLKNSMHQGLTGSETSLVSAYSFNNSINDLNTSNANNLTANGGVVATTADSPFGGQADLSISATLDYGIVTKVSTTTATVQVPWGNTIPVTGGVSTVAYASAKAPFGMPVGVDRWSLINLYRTNGQQTSPSAGTWYNPGSQQMVVPLGSWDIGYRQSVFGTGTSGNRQFSSTLSTSNSAETNPEFTSDLRANAISDFASEVHRDHQIYNSVATTWYQIVKPSVASFNSIYQLNDTSPGIIYAKFGLL